MAINEIHVADIGTVFKVTVKDGTSIVDVSSSTTKEIHFGKPDGTSLIGTAVFETDGTDGIIKYTTIANDLDQDGLWQIQAFVVMSGGQWKSDIARFKVHANIV